MIVNNQDVWPWLLIVNMDQDTDICWENVSLSQWQGIEKEPHVFGELASLQNIAADLQLQIRLWKTWTFIDSIGNRENIKKCNLESLFWMEFNCKPIGGW